MNQQTGNSGGIYFWWTPTCGYLHAEKNPVSINWECPVPPDPTASDPER